MIKRLSVFFWLLFALPAAASDWYISPSSPFVSRFIEGTQCRYLRIDSTDSGYTPALYTAKISKAKMQHDFNSKNTGTGASVQLKACTSPTDTNTCSNFQADLNSDNILENALLTTDITFYATVPPQYLRAQITTPAVSPAVTSVIVCGWTGSVPLSEIDPVFKAMDTETELETQLGGLNVWTEADGPLGGGGGGATDIAQGTRTSTTVPITSSTGNDATLTAATTSLAGVMTADDKTKLDLVGTNNYVTNSMMADDSIGIAELSATGTPDSTTFLRGDNTWAVVTGGHGDGANCSAGNYPLGVDANGAVQSCTADDDVPESGDFGAAAGLDADGSISAGAVSIADISATGTPSGTTFLRGDGVWATPPGGGTGINALFDDPAPMLSANLDANGKAIINLNRIGDRNFYVDSLSELVAAESACNDTLGSSDPTGCYIWYTAPSLTISSTLEIAGTGTGATGNNGIHLRGMGGFLSGNNINDAGTVIHWNNATGAPAVQFGACVGCSIKGFLIDGNAQATAGIKAADNVLPLVGLEIANMGFYNINGYAIETQDGGTTAGQGQSDTMWIHDIVVRHSLGTYRSLNSQSLGVTLGPSVSTTWMNGTGPYYDIQYGAVLYRDNYLGINNDGAVGIRLGQSANNLVIQGQNQVEMHSHAGDGITAANASIDNVKVIECEPTANGQAGRVIIDGVQFIADTGTNEALSCEKRGSIQWTNNNWVNGGAVDNTAVLAVNIARDDGFSGNELDVVEFNNFKTMWHAAYTTLPDPWPVTYTNDPDVMRPTVSASAQPLTCSEGEVFVDTDDGNIYTCGATNNWTLKASGSGLANIVEDTTPQLGGDLDAQQNDITNLGNVVMSPVINTTTATSPTHVKAEDKTVWMNIDGQKYPTQPEDPDFNDTILKTKAIGEEEYFINLSETEAYGKWLTVIGGGDTDLVGMAIDVYGSGGAQARGDEGISGLRMFVKDNWLSVEGTIGANISSGAGTSTIAITGGTISEDESKMLGENKIAVFGNGTNYTLTTAPPGTTDGTGSVVAGWNLYGGGVGQGQWVLGSSPSISSTGYCLGSSDSTYNDINGTASRIWLPIIAVSGSTVTTQWLNQGRDAGNPYMYPATPGSAQINIRPCVVLGAPVFNAGDRVADSLTVVRAAGFPGATSGDTFRVTAYPTIRQNAITLLAAKNLGGMYPDSMISVGNLLDGSNMSGRMQIESVIDPSSVTSDGLDPSPNMADGKHHAFKYVAKCDNWDCETLGYYRYTSDPTDINFTQYPFELNMDTEDWDDDIDRIVIRTDNASSHNLTLDKTGGWGQNGDSFLTVSELNTIAELSTLLGMTGTPSGTTYLRGDGVWATPAGGSASNSFETQNVTAGADPVADASNDTLNWTTGTGITFTGDSATDTIDVTLASALVDLADGTLSGSAVQQFGTSNAGAVPSSGGGTTNFLRADGTWAAPPGGGGGTTLSIDGVSVGSAINFDDGGDINFTNDGDGTASTTIKADSVALGTDTTNNYVASVATTGPISGGAAGSEGAAITITTSMATNRLIGRTTAATGVMEEITVGSGLTLGTLTLDRAALTGDVTASAGSNATTVVSVPGSATVAIDGSEVTSGQVTRARGGTGADTSAYADGLLGSNSGGSTIDVDTMSELETALGGANVIQSTEIDTVSEINSLTTDADVVTLTGVETFATGTKTVTAKFDFGGGILEIPNGATLPATCTVGDSFMDTDATTGQRFYLCQSTNTWALQGDGGGGGTPGGSDTQVQFNDGGAFGGDAGLTYNKTTDALSVTGALSAASMTTTPSTNPAIAMRDSNNTDSEDNVRISANCTVTTSAAEDCDVVIDQYVDGVVKNALTSVGDGALTLGSDQNTGITLTTDGTGNAELTVPNQSISGAEILNDTINATQVDETTNYTWTGVHDFGSASFEVPNSTTLPATCTVGQMYMDTDATTGQRIYACQATNTWALQGDGGGGGSPGGSNTQVQFNDSGAFGGDAGLTYDKTTDALTVGAPTNPATAGAIRLSNTAAINWRNAANSANIGLSVDASDRLVFGTIPLLMDEQAAPATPAAGKAVVYVKNSATAELCTKDDAGTETCMSSGSGGSGITYAEAAAASLAGF